jgi:hypothetical protein
MAEPLPPAPPLEPLAAPETKKKRKERERDKPPWEQKPKIRIRGLVQPLLILADRPGTPNSEFTLNRARLEVRWTQGKIIEGRVEFELGTEGEKPGKGAFGLTPLRDAYIRVMPDRAFRVRAGQFKRPFNRLKLTSPRELKLVFRGISDWWIVQALQYGDFDVGAQVDGHLGKTPGFRYALGVFNGNGRNRQEVDLNGAKDFVGRVEVDPVDWLSVGLDGSYKLFDRHVFPDYPAHRGLMGGADFEVQTGGLYVLGAGMYGDNYFSLDHFQSMSLLLMGAYKIPLTSWWDLMLEPIAKGEILKIEQQIVKSHIWSATLGANLYVGRYLCLMFQDEAVWPMRNTPDLYAANFDRYWQEQNRFFVQASFATDGPQRIVTTQ